MIDILLLGGFRLQSGDEIVTTLTVPRLQSLLAYLVIHRQTLQLRQQLAFVFWPDSSEAQARTNLRHTVHDLRQALPNVEQYLDIDSRWLRWRLDALFTLDVHDFEELVAQATKLTQQRQCEQAASLLERAVELYRGPLLPSCYDDWILAQREELAQRYAQALAQLIDLLEGRRSYEAAIGYAQRLLRHDPLVETTYQRLMRLHALQGDRGSALRVFHECAAMLAREFGVEPSAETSAAYARLIDPSTAATSSVELLRSAVPAELVGRQQEWQQLLLTWQRANQGIAQVLVLTGEAGIGKTRLAEALCDWVRRQGMQAMMVRAYEAEGRIAYAPLIDLLRMETVASGLANLSDAWLAQVARLLPELLDQHPHLAQAKPVGEQLQSQRRHFHEALARAVLADGAPLLLVLDDAHWCDSETLDWLRYLLRYAPRAKLLLVVTVRSGEAMPDHPLHAFLLRLRREYQLTQIELARLARDETAELAAQVAGRTLETAQTAELHRQTDGNPLFVVELVRASVARWAAGDDTRPSLDRSGTVSTAHIDVSPSFLSDRVQAVIQARLAHLTPEAQEAARVAAVIGRAFSLDLLTHASSYNEDELVRGLDELWQRHILREAASYEYDFSHPHIREVAYRQISPMRRRVLHRRSAQALQHVYGQGMSAISSLIATHYEVAGDAAQALQAYRTAVRFAKQTYAYAEAVEYLRRSLALLSTLPDSKDRPHQELELQLDLGWALMMAKSWTDPEAQNAYDRALALCRYAGTDRERFDASWGLHEIYLFRAKSTKALEASQICWDIAQQTGDPELYLQAHHAFWGVYHWFRIDNQGLRRALEHTKKGIELYDKESHRTQMLRYGGHDPGACARGVGAKSLWQLGYPDQAIILARDGLDLSRQLNHPYHLCMSFDNVAQVHCFRREANMMLKYLEQSRLVAEANMISRDMYNLVLRGWAQGQITPSAEAAALVRQGLANWRALEMNLEQLFILALLAETCERVGQIEEARQAIEEGLKLAHTTGEEFWQPELYRLQGHYLLAEGDTDAAQESLLQALQIAQKQEAKSLELSAAMSLSRLWADLDRREEAYNLLAGVYGWFTEGFDTADLREAKALLAELAPC